MYRSKIVVRKVIDMKIFCRLAFCFSLGLFNVCKANSDMASLFDTHAVPALEAIDIEDASSLYRSQMKLMLLIEYYNHDTDAHRKVIVDTFLAILQSLPYLNELREKKQSWKNLEPYLLDTTRSGEKDRRLFPTMIKDQLVHVATRESVLQFSYLLSRLTKRIILRKKSGEELQSFEVEFLNSASNFLFSDLIATFYENEAWWYTGSFPNIKFRTETKLNFEKYPSLRVKSYFSVMTDEDFFFFAIASDLDFIQTNCQCIGFYSAKVIKEIKATIFEMFAKRLGDDSGFVFDEGKWTDHPRYHHAGYEGATPPQKPSPKKNLIRDTSHDYRWPLWLDSYRDAYAIGTPKYKYFDSLFGNLAKQFERSVIYDEFGPKVTNYFDGSNGWHAVNKGRGYGPFTLSKTAAYGSWFLLANSSKPIKKFMDEMEKMIVSKVSPVVEFRTKYYGEYDFTNGKMSRNGIREIDMMGKGSFYHYNLLMARAILNAEKSEHNYQE